MALIFFRLGPFFRKVNPRLPATKLKPNLPQYCTDVDKMFQVNEAPLLFTREVLLSAQEAEYERKLREEYFPPDCDLDVSHGNPAPKDVLYNRVARITQRSKNCMQSGTFNCKFWQIDFDTVAKWENPLMGCTASPDTLGYTFLSFETEEDAIYYCAKNGFAYFVDYNVTKPNTKVRMYAGNFSWNKRCRTSTK